MKKKEYECHKKWRQTKIGRASYLRDGYKLQDKKYGYGETTITTNDIVEMLNNGCYWCGEKDWHKLGADRIDNTKPHTKENCVCSCWNCNFNRSIEQKSKPVFQYTLDGEFVAEYPSIRESARQTGLSQGNISKCCNNKTYHNSAGGFVWRYVA